MATPDRSPMETNYWGSLDLLTTENSSLAVSPHFGLCVSGLVGCSSCACRQARWKRYTSAFVAPVACTSGTIACFTSHCPRSCSPQQWSEFETIAGECEARDAWIPQTTDPQTTEVKSEHTLSLLLGTV
eukprot:5400334-Amphidinium_carterae.1